MLVIAFDNLTKVGALGYANGLVARLNLIWNEEILFIIDQWLTINGASASNKNNLSLECINRK